MCQTSSGISVLNWLVLETIFHLLQLLLRLVCFGRHISKGRENMRMCK
uniref:Uncharacterized protein n=1 Tax=Rhizophora mucronata TaxID=61149 RepID=A0A2P2IL79_RHIMU